MEDEVLVEVLLALEALAAEVALVLALVTVRFLHVRAPVRRLRELAIAHGAPESAALYGAESAHLQCTFN